MFLHFMKSIDQFFNKIKVLNSVAKFSLNQDQINTFQSLKQELAGASMQAIDENIPFTAEADESGFTISETLNQNGRPKTFHSKTLQANEQHHSPVGKEAQVMFR